MTTLTYKDIMKVADKLCPYSRNLKDNYKGECAFGYRCKNILQDFRTCRNYQKGIERKV
jgi:hypothetical protein